jgi:hypothetical protein
MSFSKIVKGAIDLADKLAPLLEGTPAGAIIELGEIVVDQLKNARSIATTEETSDLLEATIEELEPKVLAHLDETIKKLG